MTYETITDHISDELNHRRGTGLGENSLRLTYLAMDRAGVSGWLAQGEIHDQVDAALEPTVDIFDFGDYDDEDYLYDGYELKEGED